MNKQFEILLAKSQKYAAEAMSNALSRSEARMMYHGIYIPSVTYPFPLTCLTEGQCQAIEIPFLKTILPRCGYNRSMSRCIRFTPVNHGGAGFLSLYMEQSIQIILMAMKHLRCPDQPPGGMLLIALTWAQAYAGVSWSIWQFPKRKIPPLPNPWIVGVKSALAKIDAAIMTITKDHVPTSLRRNDWHIMDEALNLGIFSAHEIEDINAYRRYYQAITASDITDDQGKRIRREVWEGLGNPHPHDFNQEFFNQPRPDATARRTWRKFLHQKATNDRRLLIPLHNWMITYGNCRRRPSWVFDSATKCLYHRISENNYKICQRHGHSYSLPDASQPFHTPPLSAYPTDVTHHGNRLLIRDNFDETNHTPSRPPTFQEFINSLEPWESQLLEHTELKADPARIMELLNDNSMIFLSSDGSVCCKQFGSFGFTVTHVQSQRRLVLGCGPVPGDTPSSFRAEAYGVLAVGRLLLRLSEFTGIVLTQRMCHWVDNEGVVKRITAELSNRNHHPNSTLLPDWDVIHEISKTFLSLPDIQYRIRWIQSHQDSTTAYRNLTLAAQLNCDADNLANKFHSSDQGKQQRKIVPLLPNTHAHLVVQGCTVTSKYKASLRYAAALPPYHQYLQQRFDWHNTTIHKIDWDLLSVLLSPYDDQRPTLVKHLHGIAPTGKYTHRYNNHTSARCPSCPCLVETNNHVIQCLGPTRAKWRIDTIQKLKATGTKDTITDQAIVNILLAGIQYSFHDDHACVSPQEFPAAYHQLVTDQNEIGWLQLFRGRWAKEWKRCFAEHAVDKENIRPETEAAKWVYQCGQLLLSQWCHLWKMRNDEQHDSNKEVTRERIHHETKSMLEELYKARMHVMPVDRQVYLFNSAEEHLQSPGAMEAKLAWCHDVAPAIHASVNQARTQGIDRNNNIQRYMTPIETDQIPAQPDKLMGAYSTTND